MKVDVRVYVETPDNFDEGDLRKEIMGRLNGVIVAEERGPVMEAYKIVITSRTGVSRWSRIVRRSAA